MPGAPRVVGPSWFGPQYAEMNRHDPHAAGSIDRQLIARAVGLDARTAPGLYRTTPRPVPRYRAGSRPRLESIARSVAGTEPDDESRVRAIVRFSAGLGERAATSLDDLRFGGTEEAIVARGSNWCPDVARVAAALSQVVGIPARLVHLADTERAYSGHTVVEAFRRGRWGCVDSLTGVVYQDDEGRPSSTWDLVRHPGWIARHYRAGRTIYSRVGQFRRCAIAEYRLPPTGGPEYRTTRINAYYRSILRMSERGWPGGLRWLHGEGGARSAPRAVRG
jgi:hypothetical protein